MNEDNLLELARATQDIVGVLQEQQGMIDRLRDQLWSLFWMQLITFVIALLAAIVAITK